MDLFTIVGMLLSVFGSSFSANAALRGHYEEKIRDGHRESAGRVAYIKTNDTSGTGPAAAQQYADTICSACKWWNRCHWIPILLFCVTSFALSLYVVFWEPKSDASTLWHWGRWGLLAIVIIDLACFVGAFTAYRVFKHADGPLTLNFRSCQERKAQEEARSSIAKA